MPVRSEYQRATDDLYKTLMDVRDSAGLTTTNQAYTMAKGVFQVFRRRLEVNKAIRFLSVLPVGVRALFVADWDIEKPKRQFTSRKATCYEAAVSIIGFDLLAFRPAPADSMAKSKMLFQTFSNTAFVNRGLDWRQSYAWYSRGIP
jgi:hypothetical protein